MESVFAYGSGQLWVDYGSQLQPLRIMLPIAARWCHYCDVHAKLVAKLDFVSIFGLNYVAGVETTVRILMVNSCDSVGTRSQVSWVSNFCRVGSGHGSM